MMSVHEAAEEGNEEELLRLIQKDITSVNEDDEYGETPLHLACSAGHANCVKLLLNNGAEVDSQNSNGVTPLHQSARLGRAACVSLLLRKGANVTKKDNSNWTPLHYAVFNGQAKCAAQLIEKAADVNGLNIDHCTPLHLAASAGALECVLLLIKHGAKVNIKNKEGNTPVALLPITSKEQIEIAKNNLIGLSRDLRGLVNNRTHSDLAFIVEGGEGEKKKIIYAHRVIVSQRCPKLRDIIEQAESAHELSHNILEVAVTGISPLVFECFLEFLYTGQIENVQFQNSKQSGNDGGSQKELVYLMELLRVADMYTYTPLNRYCEEVLMENLNAANAVGFLIITDERRKGLGDWGVGEAARRCFWRVRKICGEYLVEHFNELVDSKTFRKLKREVIMDIVSQLSLAQRHKPAEYIKRSGKTVPPTHTRAEGRELMKGSTLAACKRIIADLMGDRDAWPFNQPVDPVALKIPSYREIIKHPMDFGTIKDKLNQGQYPDVKSYAADMRLVFMNALTFNEPGSSISNWAQKLRKIFEKKFEEFVKTLKRREEKETTQMASKSPAVQPVLETKPKTPVKSAVQQQPGLSKRKRPSEMSHDARYALGQKINSLEGVQLFRVLEIINEATPPSASEEGDSNGDIEIDLSDLDAGTLYRLQEYVEQCLVENKRKQNQGGEEQEGELEAEGEVEGEEIEEEEEAIIQEISNDNEHTSPREVHIRKRPRSEYETDHEGTTGTTVIETDSTMNKVKKERENGRKREKREKKDRDRDSSKKKKRHHSRDPKEGQEKKRREKRESGKRRERPASSSSSSNFGNSNFTLGLGENSNEGFVSPLHSSFISDAL